ncbi:MAG: DNA methylase [Candidatus Competibacteraceae bacterium]|nr:DNA methylase [Candidatus Competibacteraceae bacterium]
MANHHQQTSFTTSTDAAAEPVECLGLTFPNEEARRAYFTELLREKLQDPEFRQIEGFPIGTDEDILALSDPPYYTACPNPFLADFIEHHGKPYDPGQPYRREPFAVDVSEGKTDPIYKAHSYHTKVPHLAIVPSILHYTEPGDVVLDGFCGSGMTGVAAQWCGSAPQDYRRKVEAEFEKQGLGKPHWGVRRAVLNDLSPAATFITANYNLPFDVQEFARAGQQILDEVQQEIGWMYETRHVDGKTTGHIEYTVWSEVFTCPNCTGKVVFLDEALDVDTKRVRDAFPCPHCGSNLTKDNLQRVFETRPDPANGKPWKRVKYRPALITYTAGGKRQEKKPDADDLEILQRIEAMLLPVEIPTHRFPIEQMYHGSRIAPKGFSNTHHFFLPRAAHALAALWRKANAHPDARIQHMLLFSVEQAIWGMSVLNRYQPIQQGRPGGSQVNRQMTGVYYVASQIAECSPQYNLGGKLNRLGKAFETDVAAQGVAVVTVGTAAHLRLPDSCIDYIFTDPPFGENIYYADLNFLVESWHRVITDAMPEAIVDKFKQKGLPEYQRLMQRCFEEYCRVLKPGRWMTVVFHNSRNAVWNAIQEAMQVAGFVVADVRTLDKQQGSYRQVTSSAVKQDLVISAYKPNGGLEERFKQQAGTEPGVWDFVSTHLKQLPIFVAKDSKAELIVERQNYLLFDRMVAFHVQRGYPIPLSSPEFHAGLRQRFPERDGMYFLPEQVPEYDQRRLETQDMAQLELFVSDEKSAIQWVRRQLTEKPLTYQDLQPLYMKEAQRVWEKHEQPLELRTILEQNFVEESDGTWRIPDPKKESDLEQMRHRVLIKEFQQYLDAKGKLKVIRTEALRAGFKDCWQKKDYATILHMAKRVPEAVIQEDPALLMYADNAALMLGE